MILKYGTLCVCIYVYVFPDLCSCSGCCIFHPACYFAVGTKARQFQNLRTKHSYLPSDAGLVGAWVHRLGKPTSTSITTSQQQVSTIVTSKLVNEAFNIFACSQALKLATKASCRNSFMKCLSQKGTTIKERLHFELNCRRQEARLLAEITISFRRAIVSPCYVECC